MGNQLKIKWKLYRLFIEIQPDVCLIPKEEGTTPSAG